MFTSNNRPARKFSESENVTVRHSDKWVTGTIRSQTGPISYKVNIGPGSTWRRHTDQIVKGNPPFSPLLPLSEQSSEVQVAPHNRETNATPVVNVPEKQPNSPERKDIQSATLAQHRYPGRSNRKAPKCLDI